MGQDFDPRAASVHLAAEAAVLEARMRILQEALDDVGARIQQSLERLHRLRERALPATEQTDGDSPAATDGPGHQDRDACRK
jgi:hypothetical protein